MKTTTALPAVVPAISETDVREYAYHLYCQNGCNPGHELDNWLEAEACLRCSIPQHLSHRRIHLLEETVNRTKSAPAAPKAGATDAKAIATGAKAAVAKAA